MQDPTRHPEASAAVDLAALRADFPALDQRVHGRPLVYLDNAATALKPNVVIEAVTQSLARDCANIHRAVHTLSARATEQYEGSRETVRRFFGVRETAEVIFVRGATEGINLVAHSWGREHVGRGDEVLITGLEHHSNIVPWQHLCDSVGATLKIVPVQDDGDVSLDAFSRALSARTRLVAVTQASNALGTILPVEQIVRLAHEGGAAVLVDGAQGAPHLGTDVQRLGCDFYVASAHKLYGPTGVGVLLGRRERLEEMSPYQTGGDMIRSVTFEKTLYAELPHCFEAGTPNIAGVVGFGAALRYLEAIGFDVLGRHEQELLGYGTQLLRGMRGVRLIGTAPRKIGVLSFLVDGIHPHDLGTMLDTEGVAIRTGHHCAQPLMERFGVPATARVSLGLYNTRDELSAFARALVKAQEFFGR
ncbi:MAG: cysteine desulfurase [Polyangiaceae bacterium]|nr:cysteine desulfurase [Polyangiaceae bacterium]